MTDMPHGVGFTRTRPPIIPLDASIVDALSELRGARQIAEHQPCAETQQTVALCEWRLDVLLGRKSAEESGR